LSRKIKDTAFSYLFNEETHVVDLYKAFTGIMLDPNDIMSIRLADSLTESPLYNDVAFITKNEKLIVLIEHESTFNPNMSFRLTQYYMRCVSKLIKEKGHDKHGKKKIEIPRTKFFVAYNGEAKFPAQIMLDLDSIHIKINTLDVRYECLNGRQLDDALAGYAYLIRCYEENIATMNEFEAHHTAMEQTLEAGYLVEVLSRKECRDMLSEIFSYEAELKDIARFKGVQEGILQTAKRLLKMGLSVEVVVQGTGLCEEEIQQVQDELESSFNVIA